jgi:hypothetical protein
MTEGRTITSPVQEAIMSFRKWTQELPADYRRRMSPWPNQSTAESRWLVHDLA